MPFHNTIFEAKSLIGRLFADAKLRADRTLDRSEGCQHDHYVI